MAREDENYKGEGGRHRLVNLFVNNCVKKLKVRVVYAILTVSSNHVQSLKRARVGRKYSQDMFP